LLRNVIWGGSPAGPRTAAIVDQLALTQPNPAFAEAATGTLEQAGYVVDYYPGEQVTVDFYRNLPTRGYDLIVFRVHSGLVEERDVETGQITPEDYVSLFTGEPFSETKYVEEVAAGPLGVADYGYEGSPRFFGIGPEFIRSRTRGKFDQTTVILMGCDGLKSDRTARAFLERGVEAFVSWSGPVSASHTDTATERLLRHMLIDGLPTRDAVSRTMAEVSPDPTYDSTLLSYP
jgi:hypothetical protein